MSIRNCFQQTGQTRATSSRCFKKGSACRRAPKGATARRCFLEAFGRACWSGVLVRRSIFLRQYAATGVITMFVRRAISGVYFAAISLICLACCCPGPPEDRARNSGEAAQENPAEAARRKKEAFDREYTVTAKKYHEIRT